MKQVLLSLALGLATVAGYAQWSNPADDIPAYHPDPPAHAAELPAVLSGSQLTGPYFRYQIGRASCRERVFAVV